MQFNVSIGTTAQKVAAVRHDDQVLDILVQNNSANNLYLGDDASVSTTSGTKIAPSGGLWANDKRRSDVFLIADGSPSDVRVTLEIYKGGTRG